MKSFVNCFGMRFYGWGNELQVVGDAKALTWQVLSLIMICEQTKNGVLMQNKQIPISFLI